MIDLGKLKKKIVKKEVCDIKKRHRKEMVGISFREI